MKRRLIQMIKMNEEYYAATELFADVVKVKTIAEVKEGFTLVSHANDLSIFDDFIIENSRLYNHFNDASDQLASIEREKWEIMAKHYSEDIHTIEDLLHFIIEKDNIDPDTIITILRKADDFNLDVDKIYDTDNLAYSWKEGLK